YSSPFEDGKQYELTELGQQFVHYTMNEIVPRLNAGTETTSTPQSPQSPTKPAEPENTIYLS
ncbi:MAG TPA: hypothetical protein VMT23_01280, partial [Candidatus Binatia bacterium]|nr:hypothetical protein [Candidatus Binatia bacterium]